MRSRVLVQIVGLVGVGFLVGWVTSSRRSFEPPKVETSHVPEQPSPPAGSAPPRAPAPPEVPPKAGDASPVVSRLQALAWAKANAVSMHVGVFSHVGLDRSFVAAFGLTSEEQRQLEALVAAARADIVTVQQSLAVVTRPRMDMLVVDIPEQALRGGKTYDQLLSAFRSVLGEDRYQYFDAIAGESFDRGLDSFATQKTKFEISCGRGADRQVTYAIKRSYSTLGSTGTDSSQILAADLRRFFPVLEGLIPPDFGRGSD